MRRVLATMLVLALLAGAGAGAYFWFGPSASREEATRERPAPAVRVEPVATAQITRTVEAIGNTVAAESVTVTAETAARIVAIEFNAGATVEKDQVLVRLDPEIAQAELETIQAEAQQVSQELERAEFLLGRGSGPRAAVEDTRRRLQAVRAREEAARERLNDATIRAPFAGRVGLRDVSVGALVQPGTALATVDAISPMDLRFSVPEQILGDLKVGGTLEARTSAFPDDAFTGEIRAIASRVDPATRTVAVEARLMNPEGRLLPGMLMTVTLALERIADAIVVPPIAVQVRGDQHFVYRVDGESKAQRVPVEIGQREADRLQIRKGLDAGDRIVVEGLQGVTDGQTVRVADRAPEGAPGGPAPGVETTASTRGDRG